MHRPIFEVKSSYVAIGRRLSVRGSSIRGSHVHRSVHIPLAIADQTNSCFTEIEKLSRSPTVVIGVLT